MITGTGLGNNDIFLVSLAGFPAVAILSQTPESVVVQTCASLLALACSATCCARAAFRCLLTLSAVLVCLCLYRAIAHAAPASSTCVGDVKVTSLSLGDSTRKNGFEFKFGQCLPRFLGLFC